MSLMYKRGVVLLLAALSMSWLATPAQAVTEGHSNRSFYVRHANPDAALFQAACPIRNRTDSYRSGTSYVVLQFGGAKSLTIPSGPVLQGSSGYGVSPQNFQSYYESAYHILNFAIGWITCQETADRQQKLEVILGVSNSGRGESYANGAELASVVGLLNTIFNNNSIAIHVSGGFDSEVGWDTYAKSVAEMQGFDANAKGNIYHFYGDYGCDTNPTSPYTSTSTCGNLASDGYTADRIWNMMYGISSAYPLPQVYGTGQGNTVVKLQKYSKTYKFYYMEIRGTLTQAAACDADTTGDPTCPGRLQPDVAYNLVANGVSDDSYIEGETDLRNLPAAVADGVG